MSSERTPLLPVTQPVATEPQPVTAEIQPAAAEPQQAAAEPQSEETLELGATPERGPYGWNNPGPMFKNAKRNTACVFLIYGIFYLLDRFIIQPNRYYVLEDRGP
ncbi:hypothetical protein FRC10_005668 [Ceratobasidium sp. 414]|nr:hypothetical protein FRC10_005668 [Ceratobasidium sp. 414]